MARFFFNFFLLLFYLSYYLFFLENSHHQGQVRSTTWLLDRRIGSVRWRWRASSSSSSTSCRSLFVFDRWRAWMIDFPGPSSISSASHDVGSASTTLQVCRGPSSGQVGLRWFRLGGGRFLLRLQEYQRCRLRLQVALLRLDHQELDLVAIAPRERLCDQSCHLLMMQTCRGQANFKFSYHWIDLV